MSHETGGPSCRRSIEDRLDRDTCREAISFLLRTVDEAQFGQKMKQTFKHRRETIHNPEKVFWKVYMLLLLLLSWN